MNIIQIQDRLKGMPKEAIIQYIQNPTGDVPTYLALGELQRRKDADAKYMASQEQPASIAEQLVAENMPAGIGNMIAQNQPMPAGPGIPSIPSETIEPSSIQAADSGIGALPIPEGNFAEGGIVAFQEGGLALDPITGLPLVTDEYLIGQTDEPSMKTEDRTVEEARQKLADENKAEMEMLRRRREQKEAMDKPEPKPQLDDIEVTPEPGMKDYLQEYKDLMGEDTYSQRLEERLAKLDERAAKQEAMDPYLALTEAGLAIAAGDSPFALQNIAAGAGRGIQAYGEARERMADLEQKRMAILDQMAQADRNARMAAVQYGMQSKQHADALATKKALADKAATIDMLVAQMSYQGRVDAAQIGRTFKENERAKIAMEIKQSPEYMEWKKDAKDAFGRNYLNDPRYIQAEKDWIDQQIANMAQAGEAVVPTGDITIKRRS